MFKNKIPYSVKLTFSARKLIMNEEKTWDSIKCIGSPISNQLRQTLELGKSDIYFRIIVLNLQNCT
jgi:hypothetical protein